MGYKEHDSELDALIRSSMKVQDKPSTELNNRLKARLYEQENAVKREEKTRTISLWYLPMICNLLTFSLFAILALVMIHNPYFARLAAAECGYIGIAGIIITVVGVRRTNMKENIVICVKKRGLEYEV